MLGLEPEVSKLKEINETIILISFIFFCILDEKISQLLISTEQKEERGMNHYEKMLFKPNERIFVWHAASFI